MKKVFLAIVLVAIGVSQSGCLLGAGLIALGHGYAGGAAMLAGAGYIAKYCRLKENHPISCVGAIMKWGGMLDEKNPGRIDALNVLPLDESVAQKLDTTIEGLEAYNDELPYILNLNRDVEKDFVQLSKGFDSSDLDQLSQKYGFDNSLELQSLINEKTFKPEAIQKLQAKVSNLSVESLKIYMQLRFGATQED